MAKHRKTGKLKYAAIALGVLVLIGAAVLVLDKTTHIFGKKAHVSAPTKPITSLPSTSKGSSASANTTKNPTTPTSVIQSGTAKDENGQAVSGVSSNPSQWTTSQSGLITVKSPTNNGTLQPNGTITGVAPAGQVQFRLIDDQAGVIDQGAVNVVNGNFTASLNFTPYSKSGRLDVFNTDANGKEINEVQVYVNF
jgi:hypothetical protein